MAVVICVAVANIVHKQVSYRTPFLAAFVQLPLDGVPHHCELIARAVLVVEEVENKLWVEPEAPRIVQVGDDAAGRAPE
jgi:hypothetical protein